MLECTYENNGDIEKSKTLVVVVFVCFFFFSEVPSHVYLESQKCEALQIHAVKAVHTLGFTTLP